MDTQEKFHFQPKTTERMNQRYNIVIFELYHPLSIFQKSVSVISVEAFVDHDEKKPEYSGSKEHLVPVFEMIGNNIFFFRLILTF